MNEPNKIDTYFNIAATGKKALPEKWIMSQRKLQLIKISLSVLAAILVLVLMIVPQIKNNVKEFGIDFVIGEGDFEKMNVEKTTIYITDERNKVSNLMAEYIKETSAGSQIYDLTYPEAITPTSDDEWINIKSPKGVFNQKSSLIHLTDNVEGFYSKGMNIQTAEAFFDFNKSFGYSETEVFGDGFLGKINSEGFKFDAAENILIFTGKTRIIINEENIKKE